MKNQATTQQTFSRTTSAAFRGKPTSTPVRAQDFGHNPPQAQKNGRKQRRPASEMIEAAPTATAEATYILGRLISHDMRRQEWLMQASTEARHILRGIRPDLAALIDSINESQVQQKTG